MLSSTDSYEYQNSIFGALSLLKYHSLSHSVGACERYAWLQH